MDPPSGISKKGDFGLWHVGLEGISKLPRGKGLTKVDPSLEKLSSYLGILGMTRPYRLFGIDGNRKAKRGGRPWVVSGAAGAVGSVVGRLGNC